MNSITCPAYAKINLDLFVTGKRPDGYHDISSVMHTINIFDEVTVKRKSKGSAITMSGCDDIPVEKNTAYLAASLFSEAFNIRDGYEIQIKKNIPMEGGLGGSSTDAAAVLRCLAQLESLEDDKKLLEIGGKIGADVPFLIHGGCALCEGIGDVLTRLNPIPECSILIVKPDGGISAGWAYQRFDSLHNPRKRTNKSLLSSVSSFDLLGIANNLHNDFEELCIEKMPVISEIKTVMFDNNALGTLMSGSGSSVFGIFDDLGKSEACQDMILKSFPGVYVCTTTKALVY